MFGDDAEDFGVMGRARFKHFWPPAAAEIDRHNPDTGDPVFRDRDRCTAAAARLVEQRRGNARWRFDARPGRDHRELAHPVSNRFAVVDLEASDWQRALDRKSTS